VRAASGGEERSATVYGLLAQPYVAVRAALTRPDDWCGFLPLNQNVKACVWRAAGENADLALYVGRKHYQTPAEAMLVEGTLRVANDARDYTRVVLHAEEGPLGTRDYRIVVEAAPRADGTLLRLHWSYRPSWRSRLATDAYLATLGRGKVGFTIIGQDQQGRPRYIQGVDGVIERNAMRYYLALEAFLQTADLAPPRRAAAARELWYTYTERYPRQLRELGRSEYLETKRREHRNQMRLQAAASGAESPLAQVSTAGP